MVGAQTDDGVIQLTRLLQLLDQILQCLVQLDIAGKIRPCVLCHIQIRHGILIPRRHLISLEIIIHMPGDGHVIYMESVVVDIVADRSLHHLIVGCRPCLRMLDCKQLASPLRLGQASQLDRLEIIPQIRMGQIAVVVAQGVIVVGAAIHSLRREEFWQCVRHIVGRALPHTELSVRYQSRAVHILAVTGACLPERYIIVVKHKAGIDELIEGRCQILPDGIG